MDALTQQNAAMVEQTDAASHTLARDAERLSHLVGELRVTLGQTAHVQHQEPANAASPSETVSPAGADGQDCGIV